MKLELKKDKLLKKLLYSTEDEFEDLVEKIHPADILDILHENSDRLYEILERLPDWLIADILEEEEDEENKILGIITVDDIVEILCLEL